MRRRPQNRPQFHTINRHHFGRAPRYRQAETAQEIHTQIVRQTTITKRRTQFHPTPTNLQLSSQPHTNLAPGQRHRQLSLRDICNHQHGIVSLNHRFPYPPHRSAKPVESHRVHSATVRPHIIQRRSTHRPTKHPANPRFPLNTHPTLPTTTFHRHTLPTTTNRIRAPVP